VQRRGGRVDVDFSSLLCESQGMVTINILYSLKPSKNKILEGWGGEGRGGGCTHFLAVPPRCIQAGRVMPGTAHIYIFINTGLYNETGRAKNNTLWEPRARMPGRANKGAAATFSGTARVHRVALCQSPYGDPPRF